MDTKSFKGFKEKKILVIGLGVSGKAVLKKIIPFADSVTAIDSNPFIDIEPEIRDLKKSGDFRLNIILDPEVNSNTDLLDATDILIVSPGVPGDIPVIKAADKRGIQVWSEIEFGWRMLGDGDRVRTIAVTGTNGKTTVVTLLQKILADSGIDAIVCGNIGKPLTGTLDINSGKNTVRVLEISSFQLERIDKFNPRIGVILNISSDHLDRHFTVAEYADTKFKLFLNSDSGSWGVFNIDDKHISKRLDPGQGYFTSDMNVIRYSLNRQSGAETYYYNNRIYYSILGKKGKIELSGISLPGSHNISNIMSAVSVSKIMEIEDNVIEETIRKFKTLEHRLELVSEISGVKIYNDSKATNPDATVKALESFDRKITLILGGKDKGMDFSSMMPYLDKRVSNIILIGETRQKLLELIESYKRKGNKTPFEVICCSSFKDAVLKGLAVTKRGEILLLSPACASFDMFDDYKDRGHQFKKIIMGAEDGEK
jgi:UDP-N-acetylmuramoylalanine--D-glutamate ligase